MAKEEFLKVAPGISIVSKGIILGEGEKVTVKNFANEKVFESLKKSKKVVTEAEFLELQKELMNPDSDSKKKAGKAGKQAGKAGKQAGADEGADDSGDDSGDAGKQAGADEGAGA